MKISTKGRYALRLMLDLATNNDGTPKSVKEIAKRQQISEKYLEQIISIFNKEGYVKSVRGAAGGYKLNMAPEEYTVGMILRLVEGDLAPVKCVSENEMKCDKKDECITVRIYEKIYDAVNDVVDNITLADMLKWQNEQR